MTVLGDCCTDVTHYVRRLRGGSQPILAQASDGLYYVIKYSNNLQGTNLPFNEAMGSELYRACGLDVPSWKPLRLTDSFLDCNPGSWIQTERGLLRPSAGICFGSRFLAPPPAKLFEILPASDYPRIANRAQFWLAWLIDICAEHADNRQALFLQDPAGQFLAHFVDHGHLFGGPKGDSRVHFRASQYLDSRIYPSLSSEELLNLRRRLGNIDVDGLWRAVLALPDSWKAPSALRSFGRCLQRLSQSALLCNLLDTIVDSVARRVGIGNRAHANEYKPPAPILRSGVQTGGAMVYSALCGVCDLARS